MHVYVKECLEQIQSELIEQFKLIFVQLDKVCEKEKIQRRIIYELKNEMKLQEITNTELQNFAKWEEIEHDHFTNKLKENYMKAEDISKTAVELATEKSAKGLRKFYERIKELTPIDHDTIDLSQPFKLYSSNIRLKLHEKLNIMERETVRIYRGRIEALQEELEFHKSQSNDLNTFQEILAQEKRELESMNAEKEKQLRHERNQRAVDNAKHQEQLKDTVAEYEIKIRNLSQDAEELYRIFVKELKLKDSILDQTN